VVIGWERRKRGADDIALSSKDVAGLESCLLPNKLEADQLLAASERQLPNNVHSFPKPLVSASELALETNQQI
jgi:hypothetical protein